MTRALRVGWVVGVALLFVGSLFAIAAARESRPAPPRVKAADRSGHPLACMAHRSTGVKRTLLNDEGTVEPGQLAGATGTCPRKYPTPVSAWFSAMSNKVVLASSIPLGSRKWAVSVVNLALVAVSVSVHTSSPL